MRTIPYVPSVSGPTLAKRKIAVIIRFNSCRLSNVPSRRAHLAAVRLRSDTRIILPCITENIVNRMRPGVIYVELQSSCNRWVKLVCMPL